ncbi:MAG: hypothetical protein QXE01_09845 [Sulfolobales archaeon]
MVFVELKMPREAVRLLLRAVEAEVKRLELEISTTMERVKRYEEKYGMSSEEFLSRYLRGELGDNEDFIEWYGELVFLERARMELEELKKVGESASKKLSQKG